MKIVFVQPMLTGEERFGSFAKMKKESEYPPLSLCYLAAMTKKHGYETSIIDFQVLDVNVEEAVRMIISEKPDVVGITSTTVSIQHAAELAKTVKKTDGSILTIIGGSHISALAEETMKMFPQFDLGVIGEGEITVTEVLEALKNGKKFSEINGLIVREDGGLKITPKREFIKDLDSIPLPDWSLLPDIRKYYNGQFYITFDERPTFGIIISRGCIGKCTFCDKHIFGSYCRSHSPRYIMNIIKDLYYNYGKKHIFFMDDTFTLFRKQRMELFKLLEKEKMDLTWSCNTRVDCVDKELLQAMKKSGCTYILYGIESGSQRMLNFMKKGTNLKQIEDAIKMTREVGLNVHSSFMIGLPTEDMQSVRETINFAKKLDLTSIQVSLFSPLPGTELYDLVNNDGKLSYVWNKLSRWNVVYCPEGFTEEKIKELHKCAYKEFFFRPKMVWTYLKMIKRPRHAKVALRRFLILMEMLIKKHNNYQINF